MVTKNNMTSSASMEIEIVPGNPPIISPIALENRYKPDTGFTINGNYLVNINLFLIFPC